MKRIQLWKNRDELSDLYALVDDEDYERVVEAIRHKNGEPGKWYGHFTTFGYCYAVNGDRRNAMHRVVMNAPKGMDVDHINHDTLDNRKENLRICNRSQNSSNRKLRCDAKSGFKGVYEVRERRSKYTSKKTGETKVHVRRPKKPWNAYVGDPTTKYPRNKHINLGYYETAEEAARARDRKALEVHGEFAYLNFPEEREERLKELNNGQYRKKNGA